MLFGGGGEGKTPSDNWKEKKIVVVGIFWLYCILCWVWVNSVLRWICYLSKCSYWGNTSSAGNFLDFHRDSLQWKMIAWGS